MKKKMVAMAAASIMTMGAFGTVAFADTTPSTTPTTLSAFDTKYQSNAAMETSLLQQAQSANSTDGNVTALLSAAQTINQQVTSLYTAEQALAAARSSIPTTNPQQQQYKDQLATLNKQRQALLNQSNNEWKIVNLYGKYHNKALLSVAIKAHDATNKKLTAVTDEIKAVEKKLDAADWKNHPYDGGLIGLQDSILRLQTSAMHYTNEALVLEGVAATQSDSSSTDGASTGDTSTPTSPSASN